ncbi:MAG: sulfite exporter TauE/SafE family protein [Gammaproteobacteria bacterium]|nr:sulfite exporter TauE/SafE family protein [Gammaproteobacteria bacterium]
MFSILILGLLLGLQHAMEADHLAAVASLTTRGSSLRDAASQGAAWGLGHSLMLILVGGSVLLVDGNIGEQVSLLLESAVGVMLILLGADVLLRLWRKRVHFHVHSHDTQTHFHAHSHAAGHSHAADPHHHQHTQKLPWRSLIVGMVHGMAGSAALIIFALGGVQSIWEGLAYIAVFGLGSILGMTALAVIISLPLRWSARSLTWAHNGLTAGLGIFTLGLGTLVLHQTGRALMVGAAGV